MKQMLKHLCPILIAAVLVSMITGCSMKLSFDDDTLPASEAEPQAVETGSDISTRKAFVSIIQYSDHTSLNESCESIQNVLKNADVDFDVTVGSKNAPLEDCEEKAREIAINGSCDLVIAIGSPCAEAVFPLISSAGKTPVVFCCVTDPIGSGLVKDLARPGVNCTGVCAGYDIAIQTEMINAFQPSITKLGVIYSENEQNSQRSAELLKESADKLRIAVDDVSVGDASVLAAKADELFEENDAVMLLPDNMTAMNSWNVTSRSIACSAPLYGVTVSQVKEGCVAGFCQDYGSMGKKAGEQVIAILHGENASAMPVVVDSSCKLYINKDRVKELDLIIPDRYQSEAVMVSTEYEK